MKLDNLKNTTSFKGMLNNKFVLSSLEKISDHSASFAAGVSFISAVAIRPMAISLTPKVKKENKKNLAVESFSSALGKFVIAQSIALPVEKAINTIAKEPENFLKKETIEKLKNQKDFKFLSQIIKQGTNLLTAIPKSLISVSLIPLMSTFLFKDKKDINKIPKTPLNMAVEKEKSNYKIFDNQISFTGFAEKKVPKVVSGIMNSEIAQNFAIKHSKNDKNIARNVSVLTDVLLAGTSSLAVANSKKIDKQTKKPLISNKIISTAISILVGCSVDKVVQKSTKSTIDKFIKANKDNPKLLKYIEGINIARPTLIFAGLYYALIPMISAYFSDKCDK